MIDTRFSYRESLHAIRALTSGPSLSPGTAFRAKTTAILASPSSGAADRIPRACTDVLRSPIIVIVREQQAGYLDLVKIEIW